MKAMDKAVRLEVLRRLERNYGLQQMKGTPYMRKGTCPACGKKELYSRSDEPWFIKCGRESKCGDQWHVKELFEDLFDDVATRADLIVTFLAMLEMIRLKLVRAFQQGGGAIRVYRRSRPADAPHPIHDPEDEYKLHHVAPAEGVPPPSGVRLDEPAASDEPTEGYDEA